MRNSQAQERQKSAVRNHDRQSSSKDFRENDEDRSRYRHHEQDVAEAIAGLVYGKKVLSKLTHIIRGSIARG